MTTITLHRPFQSSFNIQTNCDSLTSLLVSAFGQKYITTTSTSNDPAILIFANNDAFKIEFEGEVYQTANPIHEIDRLLFNKTAYDNDIFPIHGAAIAEDHKAFLLLAPTHSGKTTLTGYLTKHGFRYLTDDCILLDKGSFVVHPYTEPLRLRAGGLSILKQYNCNLQAIILEGTDPLRYSYTPTNCAEMPVPLHTIYFLERNESENICIPLTTNEKMILLMQSPITPYPVTSSYLRFLVNLSSYPCYRLRYYDMNFVAEVIKGHAYYE